MRALSKEALDRLLAAAPAHPSPTLLTAYEAGIGRGEVLKLTWERVDLKAGEFGCGPKTPKRGREVSP